MNEIASHRSQRRKELAIVFLLIMVSGNPAFSSSLASPVILLPLTLYLLFFHHATDDSGFYKKLSILGLGFFAILVIHALQFNVYAINASAFFLLKIFSGGLVIHKIGPRFPERLFSIVFFISLVSLICYAVLLTVGPDAMPGYEDPELLGQNVKSMLIFTTLMTDEWWRNCSLLWEPGAFQAIINLSLALLPISSWLAPQRRLRMICVLLALLTTFSTTGYLLFFLLAILKFSQIRQSWLIRLPLIALAVVTSVVATFELDFLGDKIAGQYERSFDTLDFAPDRFGSLLFDIHYIEKNPVFGNGLTEETRLADNPELHGLSLGHSNGLSNFVATFGFFGALLYFFCLLTGQTGLTRGDRIVLAIAVGVIVFSEQFLGYALFLGLPFLRLMDLRSTVTHRPLVAIPS
ncbi:hypothetical protein M9978_21035 [Sphingomonas sp. MG17]|uniref:O-Antigen ligase n=1 Tax=Sphingomonas tagetis TaxID=2949092 RepID=A0A9X2HUJ9_9SPHN|nr:hypothetical protein [Sphingomonas tagetis]MCP3732905.1 hypothetical protein [Sphingomonas tagetis]